MLVLFISLFVLALVVLTYIAELYVLCLSWNWNEMKPCTLSGRGIWKKNWSHWTDSSLNLTNDTRMAIVTVVDDKNSHTIYLTVLFPMTLSDLSFKVRS